MRRHYPLLKVMYELARTIAKSTTHNQGQGGITMLDDMDNRKIKTSPGQNKTTPSTVEQNIRDQTSETNIGK